MQAQLEERRGLDRRIKDLEIRLSGALSSKSLSDEEHARRVKVSHLCRHFCCQENTHAQASVCRHDKGNADYAFGVQISGNSSSFWTLDYLIKDSQG